MINEKTIHQINKTTPHMEVISVLQILTLTDVEMKKNTLRLQKELQTIGNSMRNAGRLEKIIKEHIRKELNNK